MLQIIYGILQKLTGSAERLKAKSGPALLSRPSSSCEAHPLLCGISACCIRSEAYIDLQLAERGFLRCHS